MVLYVYPHLGRQLADDQAPYPATLDTWPYLRAASPWQPNRSSGISQSPNIRLTIEGLDGNSKK